MSVPAHLLLLLTVLLGIPLDLASTPEGMAELPVTVLSCESDPGTVGGPQGREPGYLERTFGCHPVSDVGVTAHSVELGYQERCDTDSKGRCAFTAPSSPDVDIQVAVHTAMLPPGVEPREAVVSTRNYTEFRGAEIVILPDGSSASGDRRQTLTVKLAGCGDAPCTSKDLLAQVSPADITSRDAAWLAPDDTGVVSFDIGQMPGAIDLKLSVAGHPNIACHDDARGEPIAARWLDEREGTFVRIASSPGTSVTCDVDLAA